ncbi:hypothetical protein FRC08_000985 [Ceratobasidium sp. 394]|nr:hypothetical protein FRC08_000985 [Ceratobasidium sp. 394]
MPPSSFRPVEVEFLSGFLEDWIAAKQGSDDPNRQAGQTSARNRLVRRVIDEFYAQFPERDSGQTDENEFTYDDEQRQYFSTRLRDWFKNRARSAGGKELIELRKSTSNFTARMLVAKHHRKDIAAIAQGLRTDDPTLNRMTALNLATTEFIAALKKESPDEMKRYKKLAKEIRESAGIDYSEQSQEALQEILQMFPKKLYAQVLAWSQAMPVHIYCMAVFSTPSDPALKSYLALSPSIQGLEGTDTGELLRDEFLQWLEKSLGTTTRLSYISDQSMRRWTGIWEDGDS